MQLLSTLALCTLLVAGIRSESEPVITSSLYKDGHQEYVHQFHNGQPHEVNSNSGSVPHLVPNSQIQDHQSVLQDHHSVGHSGHTGQVGQVGQVPSTLNAVSPVGPGQIVPVPPVPTHVSQVVPFPYIGQKSDVPVHAGGRAIGSPVQVPFYPYFGRTYPTPVYNQYQQVPHQGVQGVYQHQVYPYSVSPYSASPYSAVPYSAVPVPTPVYPGYSSYNYPYYPQYFQGVPSYYNQQSGDAQSVPKQ